MTDDRGNDIISRFGTITMEVINVEGTNVGSDIGGEDRPEEPEETSKDDDAAMMEAEDEEGESDRLTVEGFPTESEADNRSNSLINFEMGPNGCQRFPHCNAEDTENRKFTLFTWAGAEE